MGPGGVVYKWRIDGKRLEVCVLCLLAFLVAHLRPPTKLYKTATHTLIARSNPRRSKNFFPLSFLGMAKRTRGASPPLLTARTERTGRLLHHPTLSLHPGLLSPKSDSDGALQLRDAIVLTFIIMQRLLKERLRYRYP